MLFRIFIIAAAFGTMSFICGEKERATFKVYGQCGMCETRIENSLKDVEGVLWVDWEIETLELTVKFDSSKITLAEIKKKVAAVGHDSDAVRASDEVYNNLHPCCKYERPSKK